jgi:NitT/TauT family transport system permease protein
VFVVVSAAQAGVRSADPEILRMSAVFGITKPQMFYKVLLPVSVPAIFSGLRLGLVYALLGVIGSEIIASQEGLGQLISLYSGEFRMDAVYGILIVLAVLASILNMATAAAERWLLRWRAPDL